MKTHTIYYEVANGYRPNENWRHWKIDVHATPDEIRNFTSTGYLIRENLFQGDALQRLQTALDGLEAKELDKNRNNHKKEKNWGYFIRHIVDKDEAFWKLLTYQPLLSVARAMMGPLVRLRVSFARISYPGDDYIVQTAWHQHMTVTPEPLPPWFSRPHCIDCLIYLDDLNIDTGPLVVVPESHNWLNREPPLNSCDHVDGEMEICINAGSAVLMHGNLWHRALPTLKSRRRVVIISYTPTWLRQSPHSGPKPEDGLTKTFLEDTNFEEKMLLGIGGYS